MKVMFKRKLYEEMIKAFGKKDLSKLRKEIVTDKNGHKKQSTKKLTSKKKVTERAKQNRKQTVKSTLMPILSATALFSIMAVRILRGRL